MNVHEYQAKALLRPYGVPLAQGAPAFTVEEAVKAVEDDGAEAIIFGCTGLLGCAEAVRKGLLAKGIDVPVIYLTGSEDARVAVAALKAGAVDYVWKDVHGHYRELLAQSVKAAIEQRRLKREAEAKTLKDKGQCDRIPALGRRAAETFAEAKQRVERAGAGCSHAARSRGVAFIDPDGFGSFIS